jgi:hypothetical protein
MRSISPQLNEKKANKISAAIRGREVPFIKIIFLPSTFKQKLIISVVGKAGKKGGSGWGKDS